MNELFDAKYIEKRDSKKYINNINISIVYEREKFGGNLSKTLLCMNIAEFTSRFLY